jgi:prepilin-type N-terminal cleavage/methylation domain-containing protein
MRRSIRRHAGFNLIELAVVLAIVGVLLGAVIRPVVADAENRVLDESRSVLDDARQALLGYVAAQGYFPCPADDTSNGHEAGPATQHASGACLVWHGFLPAATLGLSSVDSQGYAVDGGRQPVNRIRYAVTDQTIVGVTNAYTRVNGMRRVGVASLDSEDLLFVCANGADATATGCGTATTLTSKAVAVIWSVGGNAATGGTSVDELQNPNPTGGSKDRIFVSRPRTIAAGAAFDDIVYWIPVNAVVNRALAYGQLP